MPYGSAVARPLTDALAVELRERYGEDGAGGEPERSVFAAPDGHFVVAFDEGRAVACGGVARYDEREGEIRRMYFDPHARAGFEPCPAYGPYVDDPHSVCFRKRL